MRSISLKKSLIAVGIAVAVIVAVAGCSAKSSTSSPSTSGSGTAAGTTITEKGFAFSPADATVKVGDVVTFVNEDSAPHNVSIDGAELGSQSQGASVTWTASKAGAFPYSCVIHPAMTGTITVK